MSLVVLPMINIRVVSKFDRPYASIHVLSYIILYGTDLAICTKLKLQGFLDALLRNDFVVRIVCVFLKNTRYDFGFYYRGLDDIIL